MSGCTTCGGFGDHHDPIAHGLAVRWCEAELHRVWDQFPIDLQCERPAEHDGPHSAHEGEWEW